MSDYLWDKTGEAEEDVERLENLLGALRYQPRPLELPEALLPTRTRTATFFSRPRLAIAASLLLTLLAGSWLMTRRQEVTTTNPVVANNEVTGANDKPGEEKSAALTSNSQNVSQPVETTANITPVSVRRFKRAATRPTAARRHEVQPERVAQTQREQVATLNTSHLQTDQPLTPAQREATEKLMLALRLASAKFNYAQREMQEIGRAGK